MKKTHFGIRVVIITLVMIIGVLSGHFIASCKKEEPAKSSQKDILSFVLAEQTDSAQIDKQNKKVSIIVKSSANLAKLKPTITISNKATISPASGDSVDFSVIPVT